MHIDDYYGYQLSKLISEHSEGLLDIPSANLYQPLYKLKESGYITENQVIEGRRLRTYFHLEESGKEYYKMIIAEYSSVNKGIDLIISLSEER